MVGEFDRVFFYSYHPRMPAFDIVTNRDKAFIKIMEQLLLDFCEQLDIATDRCQRLGVYLPPEAEVAPIFGRDWP